MKPDREQCISLLIEKYGALGRYPKRSDFSRAEVIQIKEVFGPWPRALEAAGLKESTENERIERNRAKRERARENRKKQKGVESD